VSTAEARAAVRRELWVSVWGPPLWALPFAAFFGVLFGGRWADFQLAYGIALVFSFIIRGAVLFALWVLVPRLRSLYLHSPRAWAFEGAVFTGSALVGSTVASAVVDRWIHPGFLSDGRSWVISGLYSLMFSVLVSGLVYARLFYRQAVERAVQIERIQAELARAELRALRAQVNPHFLFNTLNAIASLIPDDPRLAEDLVTRLADLFRYALTSSDRDHQRLGDEWAFLRDYLAIERVRLGSRLRVVESLDPALADTPVPSLLLQPLVENAVRYAIADRVEGGTLRLRAAREGDLLVLEVADDGPGIEPGAAPRGHGVGLESVRERLRIAGPPHAFDLESSPGRGTRVRLTLPLAPEPAAGAA
jgi:sensor histidine kinase YesM